MQQIDAGWLRRFRRNVLSWYRRHARVLPWRESRDPYAIWISEIMLQQTTVAAVVPYFERFLKRFPNLQSLAEADEQEVLRLWEGLGYYSRARNIHRTARQLVREHDGRFYDEVEQLVTLPGIGRYTAGAIASFAFDRRAPIVEANTLRLYCRLLGERRDPRSAAGQRTLWEFAERLLPAKAPGTFNQALMELGATVCTVAVPDCAGCPVRTCCRAFAEGTQGEIPIPASRPETTDVTEAAVAVCKRGRYLLRRCAAEERWAGLWDFPRFGVDGLAAGTERIKPRNGSRVPDRRTVPSELQRVAEASLRQLTGVEAEVRELVEEIRHGVTRFRIRLFCLKAEHRSGPGRDRNGLRWVRPGEFADYPLSVTGRKFARLLAPRAVEE